jgi:transposase-like protein
MPSLDESHPHDLSECPRCHEFRRVREVEPLPVHTRVQYWHCEECGYAWVTMDGQTWVTLDGRASSKRTDRSVALMYGQ